MLIGYARVSTIDQNPALQMDALKTAGCDKVFTEKASGSHRDRPQLKAALNYLREGDTLVVVGGIAATGIDQMPRNRERPSGCYAAKASPSTRVRTDWPSRAKAPRHPPAISRAQAPGRPPHSWCQIQAPSSGQHLLRHMAGFCSAVDMRAVPLYPVGVAPEAVGSGVTADKVRLDDVATIAA